MRHISIQRGLRVGVLVVALALLVPAVAPLAPASAGLEWSNASSPAGGPVQGIGGSGVVLVASTWNEGTFRSTDGGRHWEPIPGFPDVVEARVAFDPTDPLVGYVAGFGGLARTLDGGATWDLVLDTPVSYRVAVSPTGRVAATMRDAESYTRVVVSDDRGATWTDLDAPMPRYGSVYGLAFGRTDAEVVVMDIVRMWVTHDEGATWTQSDHNALDLARTEDGALWRSAGEVERSTDGGLTWTTVEAPFAGRPIAARPGGGLFIAGWDGVLVTTDGVTWTNMGFADASFGATSLFADPEDPDAVFLTSEFLGILRIAPTGDGGYYMEGRTTGLAPVDLNALGASADGSLLLAGGPQGVYASRDGGATWGHTGAGMGIQGIHGVGASADGSVVIAGGQNMVFQPIVYASRDGGRTFDVEALHLGGDGRVVGVAFDHEDPMHAFLGVWMEFAASRVLETRDGGATWNAVLALPIHVNDVAWDAETSTLLVGTEVGVVAYASGVLTLRSPGVDVLAVASAAGQAYASGVGQNVWRAAAPNAAFLPWADAGNRPVRDLAASPDGAGAWAATQAGRLHRCDGIPLGSCADATPPEGTVRAVMQVGDRVFAATTGAGLWSADV